MVPVCMADFSCTDFLELAFSVAICAFSPTVVSKELNGPLLTKMAVGFASVCCKMIVL